MELPGKPKFDKNLNSSLGSSEGEKKEATPNIEIGKTGGQSIGKKDTSSNVTPVKIEIPKTGSNNSKPVIPVTKNIGSKIFSKNTKGILPSSILTEEERKEMVKVKEKKAKLTCLLKKISIFISILIFFWFIWVRIGLSDNTLLKEYGISENLKETHKELEQENTSLEMKYNQLDRKVKMFERKIKNKQYTFFSEDIRKIRDNQVTWFDKVDKDGVTTLGIFNGVNHIADYFNSRSYSDPENIIFGRHERVEIKDLVVNSETVSFSVKVIQILGRVIFMNTEIIDMINSLPIYENGQQLNSFAREKNEDGDSFMEFNIKVDVQKDDKEDPADVKFLEYIDWLKKEKPNVKIKYDKDYLKSLRENENNKGLIDNFEGINEEDILNIVPN